MLLIILSFLAGALTVLAPCILPMLPVIIGGALGEDGKKDTKRPYIIAISLIISVIVFTLLIKVSTVLIGVDQRVWVYISGGLVALLGIAALFPGLYEQIIGRLGFQAKSQELLGAGFRNKSTYIGPILIGAALGPVFSSCSPTYVFILATVIPADFVTGLIYLAFYCLGLGIVLFLIALYGQRFLSKFKWAIDPHSLFRRGLGLLFIAVGISIITGFDKDVQAWALQYLPFTVTDFEQQLFDATQD
jgi:cytochrome c biogenesis protein CcdA